MSPTQTPDSPGNLWDVYRRMQWLEWQAQQAAERALIQGQDIRKLQDTIEQVKAKASADLEEAKAYFAGILLRIGFGVASIVGSVVFKFVWEGVAGK